MLAPLGRYPEPLGDLAVRQAGDDQVEHLALANGELVALAAGRRPAGGAELAQQRAPRVAVATRAEPLEEVARGSRRRHRERRAGRRLRPRESEAGAALL